jgi:DNA adenine methylase
VNLVLTQESTQARPFLKWAGGKTQLLPELARRLPESIRITGKITRYIEPFLGGGAFFFFLKENFRVEEAVLIDINLDLVITYLAIQNNPQNVIALLRKLENAYRNASLTQQRDLYYQVRQTFNEQKNALPTQGYHPTWEEHAAYLIFLNKTCYNGLFRKNRKGEFNVPFGSYKNPTICDAENLWAVHRTLQETTILCGDFTRSEAFISEGTLVYFDPPYRPLNVTSSFTSYAEQGFSEMDQKRLAAFFRQMDARGAYLLLSNSDPRNENPLDDFFEQAYQGYTIERVPANRFINCNPSRRGKIYELIIRNYP